MPLTQQNIAGVHSKQFEQLTPCPVATSAGSFIVADSTGRSNVALFVSSATVHYIWYNDEQGWMQIPSGALAGTFGAGSCGIFHPWSITYTANGGSTTTVTVALNTHNINGFAVGKTIEFLNASNIGLRRTVTEIRTGGVAGNTITLTLDSPLPNAVANTNTFRLTTGRFFVLCAGTLAANSFKAFDVGTYAWSASLTITGLPASWGTDGDMALAYHVGKPFASGTATSATSTTLVDSTKNWTSGQWINSTVRITGGTGVGQTRVITANTGTTPTVATWTTTPDATSTYEIEGDENFIYLVGNNAVTMYKYNIPANTWATVAPTAARGGAPVAGCSFDWVGKTDNAELDNENNIFAGRYIYSFRGGNTATLDRFDIAGGTGGVGTWEAITYIGAETFGSGSHYTWKGCYIYIQKEATSRFFKFSVRGNYLEPLTTNLYTNGAAVIGNRMWTWSYQEGGVDKVSWLYSLGQTLTVLHRIMLF